MADEIAAARRKRARKRPNAALQQSMTREEILAALGLDQPIEDAIQAAFDEYDRANPVIWEAFKTEAAKALQRGIAHTSAKLIIDYLRWQTVLDGGDGWKLNDKYTSRYVRKLILEDTRFAFIFELRSLDSQRAA